MTHPDSREGIMAAARELFSAHGYKGVTVRDIATAAGVSPALVIKYYRSKAELFNEMGPHEIPLAELDLPRSAIGRALVQKLLTRRAHDVADGWLVTAAHVRDSPEPDRTRETARTVLLEAVARLIGDATPGRRYASVISCQMLGLAEGVRVLGMFPAHEMSDDELLEIYAPLVQAQVDACDRTNRDSPEPGPARDEAGPAPRTIT